jgi:putative FmdB family regulatory protein
MELEQRISEAPLKKCPKCGKQKLRRLITGGNFILKGGGWYADGYGASGSKKSESDKSEKPAPSSSSSSSSSSSDAPKSDAS